MKKSLRRQVVGLKIMNQAAGLTLEIYDVIGADFFGEGITAKSVSDALKDSSGPVTVRINSPGGDAFEGVAIYNLLRQSQRQIDVKVDGIAASAASIIAMAGDTREMGEGTMLMIHSAIMFAIGNAEDMRKNAEILDVTDTAIADIYVSRTNNKRQQVADWLTAETWMGAKDAIDRGFATGMSEKKADVKAVAAAFDLSIFKNAPESLTRQESEVPAPVADDLYMIELMRKRISILRNSQCLSR